MPFIVPGFEYPDYVGAGDINYFILDLCLP